MMRQTVGGIYHTFLTASEARDKVWNLRDLLRRIITFFHLHFVENVEQKGVFSYPVFETCSKSEFFSLEQIHHLPDLTSFNEVITLLLLLNVVALGHILYRPFYFEPYSITDDMFQTWANGRDQAMEILAHINQSYAFYMDQREVSFQSIVQAFLSHQIRYLVKQVKLEEQKKSSNRGNYLMAKQFIQVIAIAFSESSWLLDSLAKHRRFRRPADIYEWYDKSNYTVSARDKGMAVNSELKLLFLHLMLMMRSGLNLDLKFPNNVHSGGSTQSILNLFNEMENL
jgi:hypothetical protein